MPCICSTLYDMLLNTFEAARRLRIAPATLRHLINSGELRAYRLGRAFRTDSDDLDAFLRERAA